MIWHFTYKVQKNNIKKLLKEINLIIIDEFYINNLTNIILFKNFLEESLNQKNNHYEWKQKN